ncbi:unnamed protein product [Heterosigma akashiwo]
MRSDFRVKLTNLNPQCSWQDLKSFFKKYAEPGYVDAYRNGEGVAEFISKDDVEYVCEKLDDTVSTCCR